MRVINWLLRGLLFFVFFAFTLNNQQPVTVHWFFGFEWHTRMVFVVIAAFAAGCALGALAWLPARLKAAPPASTTRRPAHVEPAPEQTTHTDFSPETRLRERL
jgi:uncharacterized integral membrane protein